ncbi:Sodium/calcium exchanger protein [Musa troglodytarum]|uniref:Sodium/calcium exchanger protein n=2 Tax=Musa troglodytarum TaxID=320322 RepID=A0A9E7HR60_9LILI|nr:Sodium/calcium exchanger protein [Musa troglodytarum]
MAFVLSDKFKALVNTPFLLLLCFFFTVHIRSPTTSVHVTRTQALPGCPGLHKLKDNHSECLYVNYLHLYYCLFGSHPPLACALLALWLLVLFYLLGNTASQYLCFSVENLSRVLNFSPVVAGATLLSLGNGSPDVLAGVVSFSFGSGELGLRSVLGGTFFVSCVVIGAINLGSPSSSRSVRIDKSTFVRDVCSFIVVLSSLLVILLVGRITIWGAMVFACLHLVYASVVSVTHFYRQKYDDLVTSILEKEEEETDGQDSSTYRWLQAMASPCLKLLLYLIDMPLDLPRMITIPDVSEQRWSGMYAVSSATLAPIFVTALCSSKRRGIGSHDGFTICLYGSPGGGVSGLLARHSTMKESPPRNRLYPWLAGGFLMSVLCTCIVAEELVGMLESLDYILAVNPAILGLTVLAWGNSIGDLMSNVAMAMSGGRDGAQVAISGCNAGPIFNTVAGLGLSHVVPAWALHPDSSVIPVGTAVLEILGFMSGGSLWALVTLARKDMKLERVVGVGMLLIDLCFLSLRLSQSLGLVA